MSHIHIVSSMKLFVLTTLALLALALCGCGGGGSSRPPTPINYTGDGTSGVRGIVTGYGISIGTTATPIANATVSTYTILSSGGTSLGVKSPLGPLVAQTQSDTQGNYSLPLIPGSYNIVVTSSLSAGVSSSSGGVATVTKGQFATFNVVINYGSP